MPEAAVVADVMAGFCVVDVKPLGPLQFMPAPIFDVRFNVCPAQMGLLLPRTGVAGVVLTTTLTVAVADVQLEATVYTEYVPPAAAVTEGMEGFCSVELKAPGPLHTLPAALDEVRFRVCPLHKGLLLPATGVAGIGFTTTLRVLTTEVQAPATV